MKDERKYSILVWVTVALVVLNLSTLATIFFNRYKDSKNEESAPGRTAVSASRQERFSGRYFREHLNLNPEQLDEFQKFNPVFRKNAREINIRLSEMRSEMLDEMAGKDIDTARLNELSDSIGLMHSNLKKLTYRYYLDMRKICSPEQYPLLEEMFSETFNEGMPGGRGNMMRNRQRYRGGRD